MGSLASWLVDVVCGVKESENVIAKKKKKENMYLDKFNWKRSLRLSVHCLHFRYGFI